MPYKLQLVNGGYKVKKNQPGKPKYFSKKPLTLSNAKKQLKALYLNTHK